MFDWLKRCCGEGKIRVEITMDDGSTGIAKVPYIGDITTMDTEEVKTLVTNIAFVEYGKIVTNVKILGHY